MVILAPNKGKLKSQRSLTLHFYFFSFICLFFDVLNPTKFFRLTYFLESCFLARRTKNSLNIDDLVLHICQQMSSTQQQTYHRSKFISNKEKKKSQTNIKKQKSVLPNHLRMLGHNILPWITGAAIFWKPRVFCCSLDQVIRVYFCRVSSRVVTGATPWTYYVQTFIFFFFWKM